MIPQFQVSSRKQNKDLIRREKGRRKNKRNFLSGNTPRLQ